MMNRIEEATICAVIMHQGRVRRLKGVPFILHPMEVAQILSTMTDDEEIIAAGILHDIMEDTDGMTEEIERRFGERVASLVSFRLNNLHSGKEPSLTWKQRREEALLQLKNSQDIGVKMLWLADMLSNIRALAGAYSELGEDVWKQLDPDDPALYCWYFRSVAEQLDGCKLLGRGAKGEVYQYNSELVIKVYNDQNTYNDVEREIALSRKAFVLGIPTAISFGIVSVGDRYGAMYELVDSETISKRIARHPASVEACARIMAELAHTIHGISVSEDEGFPNALDRLRGYIDSGIALEDETLAARCAKLIDSIPASQTLLHGDYHTGNVFLQRNEPLLIDMDRLSVGDPFVELSDLCYFYLVMGEFDPDNVKDFMGFSYQTAQKFFHSFLTHYLDTEDEARLRDVTDKALLVSYARMIHRIRKKDRLSDEDRQTIARCVEKVAALAEKLDTLAI